MTDAERVSIHALYALLSVRHSHIMRGIVREDCTAHEMAVAVSEEMLKFFEGTLILNQDEYEKFVVWFKENTPLDIQRECSKVVLDPIKILD